MDMLIANRRELLLMPLLALPAALVARSEAAPDPSMTIVKPPPELTWVKAEGFCGIGPITFHNTEPGTPGWRKI
jgi:hypothetical protein